MPGEKNNKILVVAISPPPYGGQALMVQSMMSACYRGIKLYHVRLAFSDSMRSVGRVETRKIAHMFFIVWAALIKRFRHNIRTLYYVPGGSGMAPVVRDIFILSFLRIFFRNIILHFHAAGVSEVVENLPPLIRRLARRVYNGPDLAIYLSDLNPDRHYFTSKRNATIANGLEDAALDYLPLERTKRKEAVFLYVGVLQESKGVRVLLEMLTLLVQKNLPVRAILVGEFASVRFEKEVRWFCHVSGLDGVVNFTGVQIGEAKWKHFAQADIFCFPSFFESESFGNVIVEAMMFGLPVIATEWRGIPDIVEHEQTGLLVPVRDSAALAQAAERLVLDSGLRIAMGEKGREKYLKHYQLRTFIQAMEKAFNLVTNEKG